MTSPTVGAQPQAFEANIPIQSKAISNIFKTPVFEQTGLRYTYFKTFFPIQPFDVTQKTQKFFEFFVKDATGYLVPNSKSLSVAPSHKHRPSG